MYHIREQALSSTERIQSHSTFEYIARWWRETTRNALMRRREVLRILTSEHHLEKVVEALVRYFLIYELDHVGILHSCIEQCEGARLTL